MFRVGLVFVEKVSVGKGNYILVNKVKSWDEEGCF